MINLKVVEGESTKDAQWFTITFEHGGTKYGKPLAVSHALLEAEGFDLQKYVAKIVQTFILELDSETTKPS